jgi:hypothetical protein
MNKSRSSLLAGMILAAALSRLIPHPPDFSPIAALALFGGAQFSDKRAAFLVPLAAMFLSDLVLGMHALIPIIYGSFALITCLGFRLRQRQDFWRISGAALLGAILFFVTTNGGVWLFGSFYPKTGAGLLACYTGAIPFFWNTLASDLIYTLVLFGGVRAAEWRWPVLRPTLATQ